MNWPWKQKKLKITLNHARLIREAQIEIQPGVYFDLFGDVDLQYNVLFRDALITLRVYQICIDDVQEFKDFIKKYDGICIDEIAKELVDAWSNFFTLTRSVRSRLKLIMEIHQKEEQIMLKKSEIAGKMYTE